MKIKNSLLLAGLMTASFGASAVPMSGGISFSSVDTSPFSFDTTTNSVDFEDVDYDAGERNAAVDDVSGDFANYFAGGDGAAFYDFVYDPFTGPATVWKAEASVAPNGGTDIWFELGNTNVEYEAANLVVLTGQGNITDGVESVFGTWNITLNGLGGTFSWSSSTAVPEPGVLALLGLGLAGLGFARKKA